MASCVGSRRTSNSKLFIWWLVLHKITKRSCICVQLIIDYFLNSVSIFVLNHYLNHLLSLIFSSRVILPPKIDYVTCIELASAFQVLNDLIFPLNMSIWNAEECSVTAFTSVEISLLTCKMREQGQIASRILSHSRHTMISCSLR